MGATLPPIDIYEEPMSIIRFIGNAIVWIIILCFIALAFFSLTSNTDYLGGYRSFLVQSGSMEPSIMTGDIIIIGKAPEYKKNDVITFHGEERIVTHRIIGIEEKNGLKTIMTKGDANRSEDEGVITEDKIIGKVAFVVPKFGYFVDFARSTYGLIILIMIPAAILILDQLFTVKKQM